MLFIFTWAFIKWALLVNALLGAYVFHIIWDYTEMHRKDNWSLEKVAMASCRRDVARWNKYRLFLGAITISVPRLILVIITFGLSALFVK